MAMSFRNRRIAWLAAGGALLVALLVVVVMASRGNEDGAEIPAASSMEAMEGMSGMEGMDMGSSGGPVQLTASQLREFGVTFGQAEYRTLTEEVRTVGVVNYDERRMARAAPKFGGFVERLYVDFTGQPVRAGQPLLEIYSPDVVAAQEELLLAAGLERTLGATMVPGVSGGSPDLLAAARRRLLLWDVSEAQVNEVLRTGRVRRTVTLYSPASGVVMEKSVTRGQAVQAGQDLYLIADLSVVWVEAELREADAGSVSIGSQATVELTAYPGRPIAGRVDYVYPSLQEEARTLRARIVVPNGDGRLRPGMYANVRLSAPGRRALTVPTAAVVRTGERNLVFVDLGGGRLAAQDVELGRAASEYTEILTGIEPGQRVVTSAQFILDSESNLAEVMRGMVGMGADMSGMDEMEGMPGMEGMDVPAAKE